MCSFDATNKEFLVIQFEDLDGDDNKVARRNKVVNKHKLEPEEDRKRSHLANQYN